MRAVLPCVFRICSAYTNGYLHTSHCVYTARRIETAYPAPNPGRDKDKVLYCRPIACGRRLSVYVCPPCNRTPATGRCVAGKPTTITPGPPSHGPSVGCRQEGRSRRLAVGIGFFWKACSLSRGFCYIEVFVLFQLRLRALRYFVFAVSNCQVSRLL